MNNLKEYFIDKLKKAFESEALLDYQVEFATMDQDKLSGVLTIRTKTERNKLLSETNFIELQTVDVVDDWLSEVLSIMLMNHYSWYK